MPRDKRVAGGVTPWAARLLRRTLFNGRLAVTARTQAWGFALVASRRVVQVGAIRRSFTLTLGVTGIVYVGVNEPTFLGSTSTNRSLGV